VDTGNRSTSKLRRRLIRETFEAEEENRGQSAEVLFGRPADAAKLALGGARAAAARGGASSADSSRAPGPVRATRPKSSARKHCRRRLPIPPPPPAERTRRARFPHALLSFHLATRFPGCGRWTGTGWRSTFCRRQRSSLNPSRDTRHPEDSRNPTGRRNLTAPFGPRMPGFDAGRAGCWRWTRLSTCLVAALLESTRPRPVYVRSGAPRWSSPAPAIGWRPRRDPRRQPSPVFLGVAIPSTMGPTRGCRTAVRMPQRDGCRACDSSPLPPRAAAGLVLPRLVASGESWKIARGLDAKHPAAGAARRAATWRSRCAATRRWCTSQLTFWNPRAPACGLIALSLTTGRRRTADALRDRPLENRRGLIVLKRVLLAQARLCLEPGDGFDARVADGGARA